MAASVAPDPDRSRRRTVLQTLVAVLLPSGGQLTARRNAWAAMSEGAARARATREAEAAVAAAVERAGSRGEPVRAAQQR